MAVVLVAVAVKVWVLLVIGFSTYAILVRGTPLPYVVPYDHELPALSDITVAETDDVVATTKRVAPVVLTGADGTPLPPPITLQPANTEAIKVAAEAVVGTTTDETLLLPSII